MSDTAFKPVTGPDGDNPITDKQIREMLEQAFTATFADARIRIDCRIALVAAGRARDGGTTRNAARGRLAAAWNTRHGGK